MRKFLIVLLATCLFSTLAVCADTDLKNSSFLPTSTPEEQGMESSQLLGMFKYIQDNGINIHSILIIRNGHLVTEAYFHPYNRDEKQSINSSTKSVLSALFGMAIQDGAIKDTDQLVADYFPEIKSNPLKAKMVLEDLLTMRSGLKWAEWGADYTKKENDFVQMQSFDNWVQFVLSRPMKSPPGSEFTYNSGASHLLSAILQKATGKTAFDYAKERLFKKIDIQDAYWYPDPQGISTGGSWLYLTPMDMAKFGYLYLNDGQWNGEQIIPAEWIKTSTSRHVNTIGLGDPTGDVGYGYHWWINSFGGYSARGAGGQYIFIIPQKNLEVVFTSALNDSNLYEPMQMMKSYILPSIKSSPISPNPKAFDELQLETQTLGSPPVQNPVLPPMAKIISGKTYLCPENNDMKTIRLDFESDGTCKLNVTFSAPNELPFKDYIVGMDGRYRRSEDSFHGHCWLRGRWTSEKTFILEMELPSQNGVKFTCVLTFEGKTMNVIVQTSFSKSTMEQFQAQMMK